MKGTRQFISLCIGIGIVLMVNTNSFAQTSKRASISPSTIASTNITPLTVGDKAPDLVFQNVLNYHDKTARLSDFEGKVVILDMWSTTCASCIEAFPKMEALQKKFDNKLQILLVNPHQTRFDSELRVKTILTKYKERTGFYPSLPIPIHDSVLNKYFPHEFVPHIIIIDQKGFVVGITQERVINEQSIDSIISGRQVHIPKKDDWGYDQNIPLYVKGNGGDESDFLSRSIITGPKVGMGSFLGGKKEKNGQNFRRYIINYPLYSLFEIAYSDVLKYDKNRTILDVADPSRFQRSDDSIIDTKNIFCYEIIVPATSSNKYFTFMQQDLARAFNTIAKNEQRILNCYSLIAHPAAKKMITKGGAADLDIEKNSLKKYIRNKPIAALVSLLNSLSEMPIIDETNIINNIDIEIPYDFYDYDLKKRREWLQKNGLDIREVKKALEVAVITDAEKK